MITNPHLLEEIAAEVLHVEKHVGTFSPEQILTILLIKSIKELTEVIDVKG